MRRLTPSYSSRIRTILLTISFLALANVHVHMTSAASTVLGNLVASMQAGTWAQLTTNNINPTLSNTGGASGIIFGYTEYIKWDSVGHRLYYLGGDHATSGTPVMRHVQYDEASNTWSILPEQSWFTAFASHGYDHGAIDPAHRFFYFRPPGNLNVYRYNMDTGAWTQMPANNVIQYNSCCVGMDYFPELHGVMWAGDESGDNGGVTRLNDATGQWDRMGQAAAYAMGDYHNFAEYNPIRHVMVFGGGESGAATRKMWKLDATGAVTPLNDAPVNIGIQSSIFTVDPVSGDYLVFTSTNQFYVYNVVTDTWTLRASGSAVPIWTTQYADPVHGVVGGPIDSYGANVFVTCDGASNCKVNIYKHSGSSPPPSDTTPPTVSITSPAGGSTVSGTITVSANASDNVGVAGLQFQLDGVNLGSEDTATPYTVSWNTTTASNASHTLTAIARDAAGNRTTSSAVTVTVSNSTADTIPPTDSITSPTSGSTVSGTITVSANASDNVGVAGVQFQLDGANLGAEDTASPYSISWNTTTASNASHTLTAIARDAAGNRTTSSAVTVTVSNSTADTTPPTDSITSPTSGSTVSGTITVSANASDNVGVVGVQFQLDGANLGAEATASPYSVSWNTTTASNASHTLTAIARDAAGNRTTSSSVAVTTSNTSIAAKWTGGGYVNVFNGTAWFAFKVMRAADGTLSGSVQYYNNVDSFTYNSSSITSLTVTGNTAVITGTGMEGTGGCCWTGPYNFTITVTDNGYPGDRFQIQISDPNATTAGSTTTSIRRGNIIQWY